jgi:hypothetical protein
VRLCTLPHTHTHTHIHMRHTNLQFALKARGRGRLIGVSARHALHAQHSTRRIGELSQSAFETVRLSDGILKITHRTCRPTGQREERRRGGEEERRRGGEEERRRGGEEERRRRHTTTCREGERGISNSVRTVVHRVRVCVHAQAQAQVQGRVCECAGVCSRREERGRHDMT